MNTAFHVMSKPTGAVCNLDRAYCFFLSEEELPPVDAADVTHHPQQHRRLT